MKLFFTLTFSLTLFLTSSFSQSLQHIQGELLVRIETKQNLKSELIRDLNLRYNTSSIKLGKCISTHLSIYILNFDFDEINENRLYTSLLNDRRIDAVQFNHHLSLRETIPNDPQFDQQWQWMNPMGSGVGAELAWDITTGGVTANGDTIVVTVVDDGISFSHEDFGDNLWYNYAEIPNDGIDNDNNGYIDDYQGWNVTSLDDNVGNGGHGVSCAGMIGAQGNNNLGVTGINWNIKIMTVVNGQLTESGVIEAYSYPLQARKKYNETNGAEGAFVVATNSSWGIDNGNPDDAPLWCAFYDTMGVHGIISCGATANNAVDIDIVGDLPTGCSSDYLISVTATDINDDLTFAAWGATTVDLGSPGDNIYTTNGAGGYSNTSGTSFATPLTAGVIGLMYSAPCSNISSLALNDPGQAALNVIGYLFEGVDPNESLEGITVTGGRINAFNSIELLMADCGPCPTPSNLHSENTLFTSTDILWVNNDSTLTNDIRYRLIGAANWTESSGVTTPYSISSLDTCAMYEVQIKGNCASENSEYSNSHNFTTAGCCDATTISYENLVEEGVTIMWNEVLIATNYTINVTNTTTGDVSSFSTEELNYSLTLVGCNNYSIAVTTICPNGNTMTSSTINLATPGCGACLDYEYCESTSTNATDEWIASVIIGTYVNDSDGQNYSNFTDLNWELPKNSAITTILVPGFGFSPFSEYFKIWIDLNQDGEFDNSTEVVMSPGITVTDTLFTSLFIPSTALEGNTRMRIAMVFNASNDFVSPCGSYTYGETEDYCITITNDPEVCDIVENVQLENISSSEINVTWDDIDNSISYYIEYKKESDTDWTSQTIANNYYSIQGLDGATAYEVRITTICPFQQSEISEIFSIVTSNTTNIVNRNISIFPSLVENDITIYNSSDIIINNIQIIDLAGKVIINKDVTTITSKINISEISNLQSGSYFVIIQTDKGSGSYKIVKL